MTVREQREAVVSKALVRIEAHFTAMQQALLDRSKALAETPAIVAAMQQHNRQEHAESEATLARLFAALDLPPRWSVDQDPIMPVAPSRENEVANAM